VTSWAVSWSETMDTEDYTLLHNTINRLYWNIKEGKITDLQVIEQSLKKAIERSAGMTFEEAAVLNGKYLSLV